MSEKSDAGVQPPASDWTDPDEAPELTEEFFADAEVFQGDTFVRRGRGRPPTGKAKELVSFRLDPDVLAELREAGPGWQSQVSSLLRQALVLQKLVEMDPNAMVTITLRRTGSATQVHLSDLLQLQAVSEGASQDEHRSDPGGAHAA